MSLQHTLNTLGRTSWGVPLSTSRREPLERRLWSNNKPRAHRRMVRGSRRWFGKRTDSGCRCVTKELRSCPPPDWSCTHDCDVRQRWLTSAWRTGHATHNAPCVQVFEALQEEVVPVDTNPVATSTTTQM